MQGNSIILENISSEELFQKMRELISEELETRLKPEPAISYLTKQEVATKLRCSLATVKRLVSDGKIKGFRIERRLLFRSDEIESCLKEIHTLNYKK